MRVPKTIETDGPGRAEMGNCQTARRPICHVLTCPCPLCVIRASVVTVFATDLILHFHGNQSYPRRPPHAENVYAKALFP